MAPDPAYVVDDTQEIVAQNALGEVLHSGFAVADGYTRMLVLDEDGRRFFRDWERRRSSDRRLPANLS